MHYFAPSSCFDGCVQRVVQPGFAHQAFGFEGFDLVALAQRQANVVQPVQKAVFTKRLDLKCNFFALGFDDDLSRQVNRQRVAWKSGDFIKQLRDLTFRQYDGQQPVLKAVVKKDVGVAGRDDGAKAVLVKCPRCVFTR